ncbi:MAG TPA: HAD family phosphatase [Anaerolineae bacterium]|nr:HAD family phosphatase [Anaerolineae bacterium]
MTGLKLKNTSRRVLAALFDMDGVLVDSISLHMESWNEVFTNMGLPPFTHEEYFSVLGHTNKDMLSAYSKYNHVRFSSYQIKNILTRKEVVFREKIMHQSSTTPGVDDWLTFFIQNHIFCSVASSANMVNIVFILHTLKISEYFSSVISGTYFPAGKPDPCIFLSAAASLGISAKDCLVIEDAPAGIQAAKSANMICCAIATSFPKNELAEADIVLESLDEINPDMLFE